MNGQDGLPLLVCDLMDDTIPSVSSIVYDVVDLAASKFCSLLDQDVEVGFVCYVAGDRDGTVRRSIINTFDDGVGLCRVDIADDNLCTLVGKETSCFGANALTRPSNAAVGVSCERI